MRQSIPLGRIAGIAIGAHWSVLVIAGLLTGGLATGVMPVAAPGRSPVTYWLSAVAVSIVFLACLLAHELAHALTARHYGIPVRRITLWLLGGVSELAADPPSPRADLLVAAAGPIMSVACGVVAAGLSVGAQVIGASPLLVASLIWLAVVNGILAVFNLLPGAPLDGGRIVRALVWRVRGDREAGERVAAALGNFVGILLVALGALEVLVARNASGLWLALIGLFLSWAAGAEQRQSRLRTLLAGVTVADVARTVPVCGYDTQTIDAFVRTVAVRCPYRTFPVLSIDGRPVGMVSLGRLAAVPEDRRTTVRLHEVAAPAMTLRPDQPLLEAARLATNGQLIAVVDRGLLVGVVSGTDLVRAMELTALGCPPTATSELRDTDTTLTPPRLGL